MRFLVFFAAMILFTEAYAQTEYCPRPDVPWIIILDGDSLTVQRFAHKANCTRTEGNRFWCVESDPFPDSRNEYEVTASVLSNGILSFQPPPDESPLLLLPRCEAKQ